MRFVTLFWVVLVLGGALAIYEVKYEVRDIKDDVQGLEQQITEERESIHVLQAEWAYLTRPERLRKLSSRFLRLEPVQATHIREEAHMELPEKTVESKKVAGMEGIAQ